MRGFGIEIVGSSLFSGYFKQQAKDQQSTFLALPLELRMHIYSYLLPIHPAKHAHLAPTTTATPLDPISTASSILAISPSAQPTRDNTERPEKSNPTLFNSAIPRSLHASKSPPFRGSGCGHIPTALLLTCRQVYEEARMLPWEENEFVFINWFCSGVYAARAFMSALEPWQRWGMRWARIDALERDLWVNSTVGTTAGGGEWSDLCRLFCRADAETENGSADADSGLWGLRLGIRGRLGSGLTAEYNGGFPIDSNPRLRLSPGTTATPDEDSFLHVLDVRSEWVTSGLARMNALRFLELEIDDESTPRDMKVRFCQDLAATLSRPERTVQVVLVEKPAKKEKTLPTPRPWGLEGDGIWGSYNGRSLFLQKIFLTLVAG